MYIRTFLHYLTELLISDIIKIITRRSLLFISHIIKVITSYSNWFISGIITIITRHPILFISDAIKIITGHSILFISNIIKIITRPLNRHTNTCTHLDFYLLKLIWNFLKHSYMFRSFDHHQGVFSSLLKSL